MLLAEGLQARELLQKSRLQILCRLTRGPVVAARRLGNDFITDPQLQQIRSRDLQRLSGHRSFTRIAPEDGGAGLGAGHRVDAVLEHQQPVRHADAQRTT